MKVGPSRIGWQAVQGVRESAGGIYAADFFFSSWTENGCQSSRHHISLLLCSKGGSNETAWQVTEGVRALMCPSPPIR